MLATKMILVVVTKGDDLVVTKGDDNDQDHMHMYAD